MDIVETVRDLLAALTCNDRETAIDAAANISDWLRKGGFMPHVVAAVPQDRGEFTSEQICIVV